MRFFFHAGTQSKQHITERIQSYAVYIANLFFLTSDALAPVVKDVDVTPQQIGELLQEPWDEEGWEGFGWQGSIGWGWGLGGWASKWKELALI